MSDLDRYKREQEEFFQSIEDAEKASEFRQLIQDIKQRGGDPRLLRRALRRLYTGVCKHFAVRQGMSDLAARKRALEGIARIMEMEPEQITMLMRAKPEQ